VTPVRARVGAYAAAIALAVAAMAVRGMLPATVADAFPFMGFFAAIVAASWIGGFGPGMVATTLSSIAAYRMMASGPLRIGGGSAGGSALRFFIAGVVVSWLNDRLARARKRQDEAIARLAAQNELLQRAELAQRRLAAIVESSDDSILTIDRRGVITSWNRGAERLYGYTADEAIGRATALIVAPERRLEEEQILARIWAGGAGEPFETERTRKDGSRVEVSASLSPVRDASGAIVGASKIARDITERRRAERLREEILARERQARADAVAAGDRLAFLAEVSAVLTSSLDYRETLDRAVHVALPRLGDFCNVLVDEDRQLRHVAWAHVVPQKEDVMRELVGRLAKTGPGRAYVPTFYDPVMKAARPLVLSHEALSAVIARIAATEHDPELVQFGAELEPYAYVGMPLLLHGRAIGVMSFGTGARESRREYSDADVMLVEEFARRVSPAIENARLFRQADELNRLKDEFLATLSHELRTPLSAILGWSHMLAGNQLDPQTAARAVQAIERNALAQSQIVDDILDLAKGTAGNLRLELARVDLVGIAHRALDAIAPAAAAKRLAIEVAAPASVIVVGDEGRLQQVAWNLLSNAVKFTDAGGRIGVEVAACDRNAELRVTDTGIGIAPDFLPFVFDKFRQQDASFTRRHGGLGLGLAIARHLVELHGGSIEARSAGVGAGSVFVVRVPLADREEAR
jgi:PAS domain S-box-containing protein